MQYKPLPNSRALKRTQRQVKCSIFVVKNTEIEQKYMHLHEVKRGSVYGDIIVCILCHEAQAANE